MHILLAVLSGVGAILWAVWRLDREGFDFASLNPFLWKRRAHWKKQYREDPLYRLTSPLEAAVVLLLAIAKETGEISLEEKQAIKELLVSEMNRSTKEADELFLASSHLLSGHETVIGNVGKIFAPSKESFDSEKIQSVDALLSKIAKIGGEPNERQMSLISEFRSTFKDRFQQDSWA